MAEPHSNLGHKYTRQINPASTNTKTGIFATNKSLSNVSHSRKTKSVRKHVSSQSNPSLLSKCDTYFPEYPAYDPLWQPVAMIGKRYAMGPKIGSGSFGSVHAGVDIDDNYRYVAIKLEPLEPNHHPQLKREYEIYREIDAHIDINNIHKHIAIGYNQKPSRIKKDLIGIPKIFYFGRVEGHPFNALVMEMLGPSLERLFNICNRQFSLKTVLMIADQMLSRLEFIHDAGYLHRDLKPDNFLMGMYNSERVVYVVDMGLGKRYIAGANGRHIPYVEGKTLAGTARYASVNTHLGVEQSRRDDLESLGYIFMYFLRGRLPWQGIKAKTRHEKYEKIARKKLSTLPEQLCKGYPEEFAHLIRYSWRLGYEERPNYEELRRRFREVFFKLGFTADWEYDWDLKGMGATKLALDNHPFVRGNVPFGDRKSKKRRKEREQNKSSNKNNNNDDDVKCNWGGDKHHEHNKRKKHNRTKPILSPQAMIARPRHSLPILNKKESMINTAVDDKNTNNDTKQHSGCLPQAECTTSSSKRHKQNKIWNFACFQSQQTPKPPSDRINTEKLLPNRRQSAVLKPSSTPQYLHKKHTKGNRHSSANQETVANRTHKYHDKHIAREQIAAISPTQQIYPAQQKKYLHTQAYSPVLLRNNISSSPMTYTPSYSHPSSSPSPIHRRYSDNYSSKPIIAASAAAAAHHHQQQQQQHHHHAHHQQPLSGYIISAPHSRHNNNAPLRLQRSQSHRVSQHAHQGRRSVMLKSKNNDKPIQKSSAELYDEWLKQSITTHDTPYNVSMTPSRYQYRYTQQQQQQYTTNTISQQQQQQQQHQQPKYIDRNDLIHFRNNKYQEAVATPQEMDYLYHHHHHAPMCTNLPSKIGLKKKKEKSKKKVVSASSHSPQSLKSPLCGAKHSPLSAKHSPRSHKSSNKSNKSHRSSRDRKESNASKKCANSNSPILNETFTQSQSRKKNMMNFNQHRSSSRHSHSKSHENNNIASSSGSMLVNAPSLWNDIILEKSRMSVICDKEHDDDEFKMLETQFTGHSLTTNATKDERKNSGSTSKGLLTERDFSSHTETMNANRIQTTPRSYSVKHPFIKNSSNSSSHPIIEEEISFSLKQ